MDIYKFEEEIKQEGYEKKQIFAVGCFQFDGNLKIDHSEDDNTVSINNPDVLYIKPYIINDLWFDDKLKAIKFMESLKENIIANFPNTKIYEKVQYKNPNCPGQELIYLIDTTYNLWVYKGFCLITNKVYVKNDK